MPSLWRRSRKKDWYALKNSEKSSTSSICAENSYYFLFLRISLGRLAKMNLWHVMFSFFFGGGVWRTICPFFDICWFSGNEEEKISFDTVSYHENSDEKFSEQFLINDSCIKFNKLRNQISMQKSFQHMTTNCLSEFTNLKKTHFG